MDLSLRGAGWASLPLPHPPQCMSDPSLTLTSHPSLSPLTIPAMASSLDQLKQFTTVVADTGDINGELPARRERRMLAQHLMSVKSLWTHVHLTEGWHLGLPPRS